MSFLLAPHAYDLAFAQLAAGRWSEAAALAGQLLRIYPDDPRILHIQGLAAFHLGETGLALEALQQAIIARPDAAAYHNNIAAVFEKLGRSEEAAAACTRALALEPGNADAHYNRGNARLRQRRWDEALGDYRAALRLRPAFLLAAINLGTVLDASGQPEAAIAHYRSSLQALPDDPSILNQLGSALLEAGRLDEAAAAYRAVLARDPRHWIASNNLGNACKEQGAIGEAIAAYRHSLAHQPEAAEVHSNLVFALHFDPGAGPGAIQSEMTRWQERHGAPRHADWRPHENDPAPERRLRIGYVSPDFRDHVVGRALRPILEAHDRERFEWFCYATTMPDRDTPRFQTLADQWRDAALWSEEELAAQIRADGIDLLVDLALHTAFNQLPAFARKPAPVQVSWLGYPGATGLAAMDHRLTDRFLDPAETGSAAAFETPWLLPGAWCVYQPPADSPEPGELPALRTGHVTFGSFNNFSKINDRVLATWGRILENVPASRLRLLAKSGEYQERVRAFFQQGGIAPARIEILGHEPASTKRDPAEYLRRYQQVDLALDPFPYNGMTTTCEALWMGVPVIALTGQTTVGRASFSLLSNLGLGELAAVSEEDYVRLAGELARDLPRLASLRSALREMMSDSPLLDTPRFARHLEAAYREMWRRWCAGTAEAGAANHRRRQTPGPP